MQDGANGVGIPCRIARATRRTETRAYEVSPHDDRPLQR